MIYRHPYTRALGARIDELAEQLEMFTERELNTLVEQHVEAGQRCAACGADFPCPPLRTVGAILRLEPLHRAWAAAEALAEDARSLGAQILAVIRNSSRDARAEDSWSPPRFAPGELFGFDLIDRAGAIAILASGHSLEQHRNQQNVYGQPPPILRFESGFRASSWSEMVEGIARNSIHRLSGPPVVHEL